MEGINHELPPQEYVDFKGKLYRINWNAVPYTLNYDFGVIKTVNTPPRLLIERDNIIYWVTENGIIFRSSKDKRNIDIVYDTEFFKLTHTWNIPIEQFNLNIPNL